VGNQKDLLIDEADRREQRESPESDVKGPGFVSYPPKIKRTQKRTKAKKKKTSTRTKTAKKTKSKRKKIPPKYVEASSAKFQPHSRFQVGARAVVTPSPERARQYVLNDEATADDTIGFGPYVTALSRVLSHPQTMTPLTVGIYGPWGSGKTSFMKQVKLQVDEREDTTREIKQVWFNAWKYDLQTKLWAAFLQAIFIQLEANMLWPLKFWKRADGITRSAGRMTAYGNAVTLTLIVLAAVILGPDLVTAYKSELASQSSSPVLTVLASHSAWWLIAIIILLTRFPAIGRFLQKVLRPVGVNLRAIASGRDFADTVTSLEDFQKEFRNVLDVYLGKNGRLIVYIDDLDRCSPQSTVEVIETINVFLDTEQCVFVLGMDHDRITLSIEAKYRELIELQESRRSDDTSPSEGGTNRPYGEHFLDKIIQVPLSIPRPAPEDIESFVTPLFGPREPQDVVDTDTTIASTDEKPDGEPVEVEFSPETEEVLGKAIAGLESNPRTIKRIINGCRFVWFLYVLNSEKFGAVDEEILVLWYLLHQKFPGEISAMFSERTDWKWSDFHRGGGGPRKGAGYHIFAFHDVIGGTTWSAIARARGAVKPYYDLTRCIRFSQY
jgi:Cdc6-like AAA superfamily ATPase